MKLRSIRQSLILTVLPAFFLLAGCTEEGGMGTRSMAVGTAGHESQEAPTSEGSPAAAEKIIGDSMTLRYADAQEIYENPFRAVSHSPLSTFSIDVDAASYSNVRGYLERGSAPPPSGVRIEELVNYFSYDYPQPTGPHPFTFNTEVADCPWNPGHRLVRVALQGKMSPRRSFLRQISSS